MVGEEQKLSSMPDPKEKARRRELYSGIAACVRQFEPRGARALATSLWIAVALRSDQTSRKSAFGAGMKGYTGWDSTGEQFSIRLCEPEMLHRPGIIKSLQFGPISRTIVKGRRVRRQNKSQGDRCAQRRQDCRVAHRRLPRSCAPMGAVPKHKKPAIYRTGSTPLVGQGF